MSKELDLSGPNPFSVPTDEQVFARRDDERKKKLQERELARNRPVHEKTTWSARIGSATSKWLLTERPDKKGRPEESYISGAEETTKKYEEFLKESNDNREKENMQEFIQKKRAMGLARMALATKKHEIRKLDEEAERTEKKAKQQEEQLEETVQKFEDFLKENDMRAVEAMKKAEHETKGKQEKAAEIKKLSAQIAAINNDKLKHEEQMLACLRYKKFLDQLTPVSWFRQTLCNIEVQRKREEYEKVFEQMEEVERRLEEDRRALMDRLEALLDQAVVQELDVMDPDIVPMFFTDPERILNHFMEIEENNLFLIQNCQETEENLEEYKSKFNEAKQKMDEEASNLKVQIELIKQKIAVEESKKKLLMQRMASSQDGKNQKELLNQIHTKVTDIFKASGFGDNEANINTLGMLTKIETKLEELRTQIVKLPHEFVSSAMKQRDKERRQLARQKLLDEQRLAREERSQKALARSQAPVTKKIGKPVMWRSRPEDKKEKEEITDDNNADMDDSEFFQ